MRLVGFTREKHRDHVYEDEDDDRCEAITNQENCEKQTETVNGSMILREEEASVNIIPGRNWKVTPVRCSEGYGAPHPTLRR